jgi:hypothetical protein
MFVFRFLYLLFTPNIAVFVRFLLISLEEFALPSRNEILRFSARRARKQHLLFCAPRAEAIMILERADNARKTKSPRYAQTKKSRCAQTGKKT